MMWTRESEDKLIKRCLSAAASEDLPSSADEADVFRLVGQLVTTNYPHVAAALSRSSATYFATHPEEHRRTYPDVVKAGLVSDLSRLRNLLEFQLKSTYRRPAEHPTIIERCAELGLSIDQVKRLAGEAHTLRDLAFMLALDPDTLAPVRPKRWLWMAAQTCSVSYRHALTPERLQTALVSGIVGADDEATFNHFLEEAPLAVVFMASQQAAQESGVPIAQICRNIDQMAKARSSARLCSLAT